MRGAVARARRIAHSAMRKLSAGVRRANARCRRVSVASAVRPCVTAESLRWNWPRPGTCSRGRPAEINPRPTAINCVDIACPAYAAGGSMTEQADGGWGRARESRAGPCQRTARSSGRRGKTGSSCTSRLHVAPLHAAQLAAAMSHVARLMLDRARPPGSVAQSSVDMPQTSSDAGGLHAWQTTRSHLGTPRCCGMRPHMSQQRTSAPVSACHPNQSR